MLVGKKIKEDASTNIKEYLAVIQIDGSVQKLDLRRVEGEFVGIEIEQRTPTRVSHRRADLVRKKLIHEIRFKKLKNDSIEAFFKVQGGTYVKELISGDDGRTNPSIASKLGLSCVCKKLDVTAIYSNSL